ncbi:MAG TPA: hypothetical protein VH684_21130 [Xanthobacteraceae bacterium]
MTDTVPIPIALFGRLARTGSVVAETKPKLEVPAARLCGHSVRGYTHRRARQRRVRVPRRLGPFERIPTE